VLVGDCFLLFVIGVSSLLLLLTVEEGGRVLSVCIKSSSSEFVLFLY
jgi:hypothetical protein